MCVTPSSVPAFSSDLFRLFSGVQTRDIQRAMAMHVELLTSGSRTDDIGLWMSGLKQLLRMI